VPDLKEYYWTCHCQRNIGTSISDINGYILAGFLRPERLEGLSMNAGNKKNIY
jgi:hypothetical protein